LNIEGGVKGAGSPEYGRHDEDEGDEMYGCGKFSLWDERYII
jgi:hypothetical protein